MSRPRIKIEKRDFEKLCEMLCTLEEIAGFFECSSDTIERWCKREYGKSFADISYIKQSRGKIALRRYQFELAKKNARMAIWLGVEYLNQGVKNKVTADSKIMIIDDVGELNDG